MDWLTMFFPWSGALDRISTQLKEILLKQSELAAQLTAANERVLKIIGETKALLEAIANQDEVSPEVEAAAATLTATIAEADNQVPDAA